MKYVGLVLEGLNVFNDEKETIVTLFYLSF